MGLPKDPKNWVYSDRAPLGWGRGLSLKIHVSHAGYNMPILVAVNQTVRPYIWGSTGKCAPL